MKSPLRRRARLGITGLSALAFALSLTPAFAYGGFDLTRNCANGGDYGNTSQCSFNLASAKGDQDADQRAINANVAVPIQGLSQSQNNRQVADARVDNTARLGGQLNLAMVHAQSGDSTAYGHEADLDLSGTTQIANSGPIGHNIAASSTGNANTTTSGNTSADGGFSGVHQDVDADIDGGLALAGNLGRGGDGGNGGDADGGDGGNMYGAGNSGPALDATLGLVESEGGDASADVNSDGRRYSATGGGAYGGNAGAASLSGGNATSGAAGSPYTGDGGSANGGVGGAGAASTQNAAAQNIGGGANSTATGTATSGNASGGTANGHLVQGGLTGGNTTSAAMVGGTATNMLGVNFSQSGNVSSASGTVTNSGSATPSSSATVNQGATPQVNQSQNPGQSGTNSASVGGQAASSNQQADQGQTVGGGTQNAGGSSTGSNFSWED